MNKNFDDVVLSWEGTEYTIKANRVLGAIARIEDVVTMAELQRFFGERSTTPMAKIAMAFGVALRYAGARVSDDDVYAGMFTENGTSADDMMLAISSLINMMVPKSALQKFDGGDEKPKGNSEPAAEKNTSL